MIQEIMNMSTDEIKEIFDHTKNVDSKNFPLLDALYYCYYVKSKKRHRIRKDFKG
jgi:hypothetical protein